MKADAIFFGFYHIVLIAMMLFWFLKSSTAGVCFCGFMLLYTQQWWIADRLEEGEK